MISSFICYTEYKNNVVNELSQEVVVNGCKKARIAFFFASLTHFDFLDYKTET